MSSERKNINRVRHLAFETHTHTHLCIVHGERERAIVGGGGRWGLEVGSVEFLMVILDLKNFSIITT